MTEEKTSEEVCWWCEEPFDEDDPPVMLLTDEGDVPCHDDCRGKALQG